MVRIILYINLLFQDFAWETIDSIINEYCNRFGYSKSNSIMQKTSSNVSEVSSL